MGPRRWAATRWHAPHKEQEKAGERGSLSAPKKEIENVLQQLAHPLATPFATRRIAKATVATLSLLTPAANPIAVEAERSWIRTTLPGFTLWATRCHRPLLLDEAAAEVRAEGRDAFIMRCAPTSQDAFPLVFDWMPAGPSGGDWRFDLFPALPSGGGLSLVGAGEERLRLDLGADAIVVRKDLPPVWHLQRDLAIARASAVLNSQLWGGL